MFSQVKGVNMSVDFISNRRNKTLKYFSLNHALSTIAGCATLLLGVMGEAQAALFTGTSSGSWNLPAETFGAEVLDANGGTNNRIEWGIPVNNSNKNSLQYDSLNFNVDENSSFALGDLTYFNGAVDSTSHNFDGDFSLDVEIFVNNSIPNSETFSYTFNIFQTLNETGDPVLDGDKLSFLTNELTGNTFSLDSVDYTLKLLGFSNDGGNTTLSEWNLPENDETNSLLYAEIIAAQRVPEPTVLVGLGMLGIYFATSRLKYR